LQVPFRIETLLFRVADLQFQQFSVFGGF
jgi:hypothetical protein